MNLLLFGMTIMVAVTCKRQDIWKLTRNECIIWGVIDWMVTEGKLFNKFGLDAPSDVYWSIHFTSIITTILIVLFVSFVTYSIRIRTARKTPPALPKENTEKPLPLNND